MKDVFVPEYRTMCGDEMTEYVYADKYRRGVPRYHLRFFTLFPTAIIAGTYGIAIGLLRETREHMATRVNSVGQAAATDPFLLATLARAEADVEAGVRHLMWDISDSSTTGLAWATR